MANYNDLTQWKILPIYSAIIYVEPNNYHYLTDLAEGSTFTFQPIFSKAKTKYGGDYVVGWKVEGTIITPQNNIGDLWNVLNTITNEPVEYITLYLGESDLMRIELNRSAPINATLSFNFTIEYDDNFMGPIVKINFRSLLNRDCINENTFKQIFQQMWS